MNLMLSRSPSAPRTLLQPRAWCSRHSVMPLFWEATEDGEACRAGIRLAGAAGDRQRGAAAVFTRDWTPPRQ